MKFKQFIKKAKNRVIALTAVASLAIGMFALPVQAASGTDSEGYIMVTTAAQLDAMRNKTSAKYRLYADIDLTGYVSGKTTAKNGWYPIGYGSPYFTGELDGNGYTIKGLWSGSGHGISYKGLFSVTMGATIKNLNIELASAGITGGYEVGAITGDARNGTVIDNCHVSGGQIIVTGGGYAGGLVGNSYGSPTVQIKNSTVTDTYMRTSGNYAGGLIGVAQNTVISNCAAINTKSDAAIYAGGLAGALKTQSTIMDCTATGTATSRGNYAGGVAGVIYEQSSIIRTCATGDVKVAVSYAGGLVGAVYGASKVDNGYAMGNVTANYYAGGLIGTIYEKSTVFRSCAYGDVSTKYYIAGGLIGEAIASTISNTYARGNVSGTTGVGGLVGYFSATLGNKSKSIENSYSSGVVKGVGTAEWGSFSGHTCVEFKGTNYYDQNKSGVTRAYGTSGSKAGSTSAYPQGKTTEKMMQQATFVGWDFSNIWKIDENETYPYFDFDCYYKEGKVELEFGGQLKVNRLVTITASAPEGATDIVIRIKPADTSIPESVIMIDDVESSDEYKELLFKRAGDYEVTATAVYRGRTLTTTEVITIVEDLAPISEIELASLSLWNPFDGYATATFNTTAESPDGDDYTATYLVWYDLNGDGIFAEDEMQEYVSISDFARMGDYKVCLKVVEHFDNTILKFITEDDYLSTISEPIFFEVRP